MFARLRDHLLNRVKEQWEQQGGAKGKGKGVDRKKVEDIVLKVRDRAASTDLQHDGGTTGAPLSEAVAASREL